jgi:hypothetical protein
MAWIFLYASSRQVFARDFNVAGFLGQAKTFHGLFSFSLDRLRNRLQLPSFRMAIC